MINKYSIYGLLVFGLVTCIFLLNYAPALADEPVSSVLADQGSFVRTTQPFTTSQLSTINLGAVSEEDALAELDFFVGGGGGPTSCLDWIAYGGNSHSEPTLIRDSFTLLVARNEIFEFGNKAITGIVSQQYQLIRFSCYDTTEAGTVRWTEFASKGFTHAPRRGQAVCR